MASGRLSTDNAHIHASPSRLLWVIGLALTAVLGVACNDAEEPELDENGCTVDEIFIDDECVTPPCDLGEVLIDGLCEAIPVTSSCELCHPDATCLDTAAGLTCVCDEGYVGDGFTVCSELDICARATGPRRVCPVEATCESGESIADYTCACPSGYTWNEAENTCDDIDECATTEAQEECALLDGELTGACINTQGSFECACSSGLLGPSGCTAIGNLPFPEVLIAPGSMAPIQIIEGREAVPFAIVLHSPPVSGPVDVFAEIDGDQLGGFRTLESTPASVTFDATNWATPQTLWLLVDESAYADLPFSGDLLFRDEDGDVDALSVALEVDDLDGFSRASFGEDALRIGLGETATLSFDLGVASPIQATAIAAVARGASVRFRWPSAGTILPYSPNQPLHGGSGLHEFEIIGPVAGTTQVDLVVRCDPATSLDSPWLGVDCPTEPVIATIEVEVTPDEAPADLITGRLARIDCNDRVTNQQAGVEDPVWEGVADYEDGACRMDSGHLAFSDSRFAIGTGSFTVAALIKEEDQATAGNRGYFDRFSTAPPSGFSLSRRTFSSKAVKGSLSPGGVVIEQTASDATGWRHRAMVVDRSDLTLRLYEDAKLVSIIDLPDTDYTHQGAESLWVGNARIESAERLKGLMDEIVVYDRALSGGDIHALVEANGAPCLPDVYGCDPDAEVCNFDADYNAFCSCRTGYDDADENGRCSTADAANECLLPETCDGDQICTDFTPHLDPDERTYTCECPEGTVPGVDGFCENVNECADSPCGGFEVCTDLDPLVDGETFSCDCIPGYRDFEGECHENLIEQGRVGAHTLETFVPFEGSMRNPRIFVSPGSDYLGFEAGHDANLSPPLPIVSDVTSEGFVLRIDGGPLEEVPGTECLEYDWVAVAGGDPAEAESGGGKFSHRLHVSGDKRFEVATVKVKTTGETLAATFNSDDIHAMAVVQIQTDSGYRSFPRVRRTQRIDGTSFEVWVDDSEHVSRVFGTDQYLSLLMVSATQSFAYLDHDLIAGDDHFDRWASQPALYESYQHHETGDTTLLLAPSGRYYPTTSIAAVERRNASSFRAFIWQEGGNDCPSCPDDCPEDEATMWVRVDGPRPHSGASCDPPTMPTFDRCAGSCNSLDFLLEQGLIAPPTAVPIREECNALFEFARVNGSFGDFVVEGHFPDCVVYENCLTEAQRNQTSCVDSSAGYCFSTYGSGTCLSQKGDCEVD